jgi:hypothetical protein
VLWFLALPTGNTTFLRLIALTPLPRIPKSLSRDVVQPLLLYPCSLPRVQKSQQFPIILILNGFAGCRAHSRPSAALPGVKRSKLRMYPRKPMQHPDLCPRGAVAVAMHGFSCWCYIPTESIVWAALDRMIVTRAHLRRKSPYAPMKPYWPRLDISSVVIGCAVLRNCEASGTIVR